MKFRFTLFYILGPVILNLLMPFFPNGYGNTQKKVSFFRDLKTSIQNPFELRDPFKRPFVTKVSPEKKQITLLGDDNLFNNLPNIQAVELDKIKVIGILMGKHRRAMAKIVEGSDAMSKESYILKEGMRLGKNNAQIRAILPGGIVLVEKIFNLYDQEEYLETIIPVSRE